MKNEVTGMDKETIMETLTLDRIQQDLKKKRKTYCIYTVVTGCLIVVFLLVMNYYAEYWRTTPLSFVYDRKMASDSVYNALKCIGIVVAIMLYAIVGLVRLVRLSHPLQESSFVIWTDMVRKKARPFWLFLFVPYLLFPLFFFASCYWLTFYRHGRFVCGRMYKMHWWSDLFACSFASLVKNASPGDTYYLVSLDGKKIDMIYNANWFTLSDEAAQLVTLSESETPSQDRLPQGAE